MDGYELKPERRKINGRTALFNILTLLVLVCVGCLIYYFVTIFLDPHSWLNPFPPQALPTLYETPTATATIIPQPPTWTPTETTAPSPTRTKAPTWTLLPEMVTPSITPTPTETVEPTITSTAMPASLEIAYEPSTSIHPDLGCDWLGVGGQVLNVNGNPLQFQTIQLGGTLEGQPISRMTLSGNATAYGASGFEFVLGDHPVASEEELWIQLFDNTGKPLTEKIYFNTSDSCEQNLIRMTFTKTR